MEINPFDWDKENDDEENPKNRSFPVESKNTTWVACTLCKTSNHNKNEKSSNSSLKNMFEIQWEVGLNTEVNIHIQGF